jgi:catalase (peroxidase I)
MTTSINLKIEQSTKDILVKRAQKLNLTLSEYVRLLIDDKISNKISSSSLLSLAGTFTLEEADDFDSLIKSSRKNK